MSTPSPLQGQYCWIRVLNREDLPHHTMVPNKPPRRFSPVECFQPMNSGHSSAWFHIPLDAHKPGTSQFFDIGPAFADERTALEWGDSDQGYDWKEKAQNFVLVAFSYDLPKTWSPGALE
jgi:hypothetical protein